MAESIRYYATGKRKSAIARVWIMPGSGKITINRRSFEEYFPLETHKMVVQEPFKLTNTLDQYDVLITVRGGGDFRASERSQARDFQNVVKCGYNF